MIATLEGIVSEVLGDQVVLDVNGVGYGISIALEDHSVLKNGGKNKLYIYEHIRENSHDLFGFCKADTKQLFEQLLNVNGVGPRMAIAILNLGNAGEVRSAIAGGDTKFIQTASGVGKRVAERVVVDLKDKVGLVAGDTDHIFSSSAGIKDEAVQGLVALGYSVQDAQTALAGVDTKLPTEDRIRQALKG